MSVRLLRGLGAGVFGALAMAVVFCVVPVPLTAAQRAATAAVNRSLAGSGITVVHQPTSSSRSIFEQPGTALVLAGECLAFGLLVGAVLGAAADVVANRRGAAISSPLVGVAAVVGLGVTLAVIGAADRMSWRNGGAQVAFWIAMAASWWWQSRADRPADLVAMSS